MQAIGRRETAFLPIFIRDGTLELLARGGCSFGELMDILIRIATSKAYERHTEEMEAGLERVTMQMCSRGGGFMMAMHPDLRLVEVLLPHFGPESRIRKGSIMDREAMKVCVSHIPKLEPIPASRRRRMMKDGDRESVQHNQDRERLLQLTRTILSAVGRRLWPECITLVIAKLK